MGSIRGEKHMEAIKNLLDAQQKLLEAQENMPKCINIAAEKLMEKVGVDYAGALEIIEIANIQDTYDNPDFMQTTHKPTPKKKGDKKPKNLNDIKRRAKSAKGAKHELYTAAYHLFRDQGKWISYSKLEEFGVDTDCVDKNIHKMSYYVPTGFIVQRSDCGFRTCNMQDALK